LIFAFEPSASFHAAGLVDQVCGRKHRGFAVDAERTHDAGLGAEACDGDGLLLREGSRRHERCDGERRADGHGPGVHRVSSVVRACVGAVCPV
jgi:hypothetical protein